MFQPNVVCNKLPISKFTLNYLILTDVGIYFPKILEIKVKKDALHYFSAHFNDSIRFMILKGN
jgi:hypothetical protein